MRARPLSTTLPTIDVAILTPRQRRLGVLCRRDAAGLSLPWVTWTPGASLAAGAARLVREELGADAPWLGQAGAFDEGSHPGGMPWSVAFASVIPGDHSTGSLEWRDLRSLGPFSERQRRIVTRSADHVRARLDLEPIAFRLLPPRFTLADLQLVYEILLGRALHKASFRRALQAAGLVVETDEWITGGVGRPAQLYRYVARRGRRRQRTVRFDQL